MTKTIKTLAVLSMLVLSTNANADFTYQGQDGTYFGYDNGNTTTIIGPGGTDYIYHY